MASALPQSRLQFSVQKLNITIPAWNRLLKHLPKEARTLALFIDEIVRHYKGSQNSHLEYKEIPMPHSLSEEERKGFDVKVFVATHSYKKSFANFLAQLNEENQFGECAHHFLIFFYRTIRTVDEIFTLTTGREWEVVKPYRSFQFPIDMTKRLMDPRFSRMHSRDLVGSTFSTILQYKGPHERVTESEDIDRITSDSKFSFREDSSVYRLGRFKKRTWSVDVGLGTVKISKKFRFIFYFSLLDHFSKISRKERTQTTDSENEEDDVRFMFLERIHQVDVEMVHRLDKALRDKLYEIYLDEPTLPLDFVHRYTEDYFASGEYRIAFGEDDIESFNIPPTATVVMDSVHHHCGTLSKKEFKQKLFGIKLSFLRKGEWFCEPIFKFFEGEVRDKEGGHYFKIGGIWWVVRAEYFILIQQDFQRLLKKCLIRQTDPAQLRKMWLPSKDLAGFSQREFETRTQESLEGVREQLKRKAQDLNLPDLSPASLHLKKPRKTQEGEVLSQTKKGRYIVSESLPVDLELPEVTRDFLASKRELFKQVEKEGAYNERYLEVDNFIVADRILAQNIELFDLMQITDTHIYLYHVKEGFCQKTRDACSQIRVAAKALRRAKDGDVSKSILEHFWQDAVCQDFEEGTYRDLAKKKLLKLGPDLEKAKENFFSLFLDGKREVCFVYAFVDDAAKERKLEEEMARVLKFEEKDFAKLEEPNKVYEQLHEIGVLNEGQLDEGFFHKNPYFETPEIDADTKTQILETFRKKMSVFESNIAKIELLHLEKEVVNDLGFSFQICQIFRPPGSRDTVFDEIPDFLELDLSFPEMHKSRTFYFEDHEFEILDTLGDGACALHALLGHEVAGYVRSEDHPECGKRVKQAFVEKLKAHKDDPRIKQFLEDLLIWMLNEGMKKKTTQDNVVSVIKKGPIDLKEIEKKRKECEKAKQTAQENIVKKLQSVLKVNIPDYRRELLRILGVREEDFDAFLKDPKRVFDLGMENKDVLFVLFDDYGKKRSGDEFERYNYECIGDGKNDLERFLERIGRLDVQYRDFRLAKLMSADFLEHYLKCFLSLDYYHYTEELHMAAILFDKKVHFFHKQDGEMARQVFNEGDDELVLIHHKGMHFSQCKPKREAEGVEPMEEVLLEEVFSSDEGVAEMDVEPSSGASNVSPPTSGAVSPAFPVRDIRHFFPKN
ncbi:MAG: hypothetical protein K940chlam7_01518 [Chlamydiae bacterium]|nr:hypothetical protein [Chlamydiota bacterium]